MKPLILAISILSGSLLLASAVWANPATLPKHPGYPMGKAVDPVTGQSLANDPGQSNAVGEKALHEAARFDDERTVQELSVNRNDQRLLEKPGAGVLPKVEGPQIKIEPPVKEATRMK